MYLHFDDNSILSIEQFEKNLGILDNGQLESVLNVFKEEFGNIEHINNDSADQSDKIRKELMSRFYHIQDSP